MPLQLKGIHFLLTYQCGLECDHCFVWAKPDAEGVFTLEQVRNILAEAKKLGTVESVAIEGGEPFLYYPIMLRILKEAASLGFNLEILSNSYWATTHEDAIEWLRPISQVKGVELTVSSDPYHGETWSDENVRNALKAAKSLNIKASILAVKNPSSPVPCPSEIEGVKVGLWELMYRGRAYSKLLENAHKKPWREFTKCPYENLADPKRVHIDPLGYMHVCQGISIGNAMQKPLSKIVMEFDPYKNPVTEPLIRGGPVALVEKFNLPHDEAYADACHLCYAARLLLREKFPETLAPGQMYGETV